MLDMWIFKLEDMIKEWDNAHYVGSDFTKKRMIIIVRDLKLLRDDNFEDEYYEPVYEKWGNPNDYEFLDYLNMKYIPEEQHEEYTKDIKDVYTKTHIKKEKVKARVFSRLQKNYERLWD
jgi:hypothetical protein